MERKSLAWIWAGLGVVAVFVLVTSGVWRRPAAGLDAPPNATPPIIVEPIQPTAAAQVPSLPAGQRAAASSLTAAADPAPASAAKSAAAQTLVASAAGEEGASTALPAEEPARVRTVQQALQAAGYAPGAVDGKMGKRTQKAIREFQEAHGLSVDGKVGPKTWAKLRPYLQHPAESSASAGTTTPSNNE